MARQRIYVLFWVLLTWSCAVVPGWSQHAVGQTIDHALLGPRPSQQRGHAWVRRHPFTIMGLVRGYPRPFDLTQYRQAGFSALLAWEPGSYQELLPTVAAGRMPFVVHLEHWGGKEVNRSGVTEDVLQDAIRQIDSQTNRDYIRGVASHPGCIGFLANDEAVQLSYMRYTRQLLQWLRRQHPDKLAFGNAHPDPWGGGYDRYIDEFAAIVEPDVLMTDVYPLSVPNGLAANYFAILSDIRKTALAHGMPYWMFIQSFHSTGAFDRRLPSDSDLRLQLFVPLTLGYTGIIYFTYDVAFERGLVDKNGQPNRLHHDATGANREVAHLGRALRFLTSTEFGCVPGSHREDGKLVPNAVRRGTREPDLSTQPLRGIAIESPGKGQDVMLGMFRDDQGGRYFMVTNLWHDADTKADDRALSVTLRLGPEVRELHRLNRLTGEVEQLPIREGSVQIHLPGGTGDLFKVDDGKFPGLTESR